MVGCRDQDRRLCRADGGREFPLGNRFIQVDEVDIALNIDGHLDRLLCGVFMHIREENRRIVDLVGARLAQGPCFSDSAIRGEAPGTIVTPRTPGPTIAMHRNPGIASSNTCTVPT
jgi:hypothetical protein